MSSWIFRLLGLMLLTVSIGLALSRAPELPVESLVPRWGLPPSDFIQVQEQFVHLRDEGPRGDATPVLLLHGTSSSLHTWEGWVHELRGTRRVISVDLPGFGLTGPSATGDYRIEAYVSFVLSLMDHLQLHKVVLAGNSLGGEIAWRLAAAAPQRVAALALVDASGYAFEPESMPLAFQVARLPGARYLLKGILPRRLVRQSVMNVYGDPGKVSSELIDRYFELASREGNREALVQRLEQMQMGHHADRIASIKQPTLILWGGRDRLIPPAIARRFATDIAGSELHILEPLGHVPQEEDPAETVRLFKAFLARL